MIDDRKNVQTTNQHLLQVQYAPSPTKGILVNVGVLVSVRWVKVRAGGRGGGRGGGHRATVTNHDWCNCQCAHDGFSKPF